MRARGSPASEAVKYRMCSGTPVQYTVESVKLYPILCVRTQNSPVCRSWPSTAVKGSGHTSGNLGAVKHRSAAWRACKQYIRFLMSGYQGVGNLTGGGDAKGSPPGITISRRGPLEERKPGSPGWKRREPHGSICRPARPTSTRSKKPGPTSKSTCAGKNLAPWPSWSRPSRSRFRPSPSRTLRRGFPTANMVYSISENSLVDAKGCNSISGYSRGQFDASLQATGALRVGSAGRTTERGRNDLRRFVRQAASARRNAPDRQILGDFSLLIPAITVGIPKPISNESTCANIFQVQFDSW